jgi:Transposase DDE domain
MNKFTQIREFLATIFEDDLVIAKVSKVVEGILKVRSPRLSDISRGMSGNEAASYKSMQRLTKSIPIKDYLLRLFQEDAQFVIGDPTEMPRPQAKKTAYVGTLSDGKTSGYWLLLLATPFQGRALPCGFISYSSKTIDDEVTSRNRYHFQAFAQLKTLLGDKPLVLDREFSYLELMQALVIEKMNFVIRLKVGPNFYDKEGNLVSLTVQKGETRILNKVFYMGKVFVNVIGVWKKGLKEPMWVMTNIKAEEGLAIYLQRMKIEQTFRDLKSLLGMQKMMFKTRSMMENMVALMLFAYAIILIIGESLRERLFDSTCRKYKAFSGPFVFIKFNLNLPISERRAAFSQALSIFKSIVAPVRIHV